MLTLLIKGLVEIGVLLICHTIEDKLISGLGLI